MLPEFRINMHILAAILVFLLMRFGNCQNYQTIDATESPPYQNNGYWPSGQNNSYPNQSNQVRNDSNKTQYGNDFIKKESRNSEVFVAGRSDGYRTTFTTYKTKGLVARSGFGNNSGTDRETNYGLRKPNLPNFIPTKAKGAVPYGQSDYSGSYAKPVSSTNHYNPFGNVSYGSNHFGTNTEIDINQSGRTRQKFGYTSAFSIGGMPVPLVSYPDSSKDPFLNGNLVAVPGYPSSQYDVRVQPTPVIGGMSVPLVRYPDPSKNPFWNGNLVADSGLSTRLGLKRPDADGDNDKITEDEEIEKQTWQVSVFSKIIPYAKACGGSLVTSTAVISAAQCYWEVGPLHATQFIVVARDSLNFWNASSEDYSSYVHWSNVRAIHIPPRYRGELSRFHDDIAVLLVEEPFVLNKFLMPVCVSFDEALEERQLTDGSLGTIFASGMKQSNQSTILRNLKVPLIDLEKCKRLTPVQHLKYVTSDKICAGITDKPPNASLCLQRTGSGLAFSAGAARAAVPFLRGVASTPLLSAGCPAYGVRAYTLLLAHRSFLLRHVPGLEGECAKNYPQFHALLDDRGDGGREEEGEGDEEDNAHFVCNCYC